MSASVRLRAAVGEPPAGRKARPWARVALPVFLLSWLLPRLVVAAERNAAAAPLPGQGAAGWLLSLALVTLLPLLALLVTSFVRVSVVLGFVRQALGGGSMIPASLSTALALLLTLFIMAPTLEESARLAGVRSLGDAQASALDLAALERAEGPLRAFLKKHADAREVASFRDLSLRLRAGVGGLPSGGAPPPATADAQRAAGDDGFLVLMPAFVASELRRAFEMGLLLFLPFLVVDLVVANLLAVSGLQGLSPAAVAVPLKLLLFLLADGWHLLLRGLVEGFL